MFNLNFVNPWGQGPAAGHACPGHIFQGIPTKRNQARNIRHPLEIVAFFEMPEIYLINVLKAPILPTQFEKEQSKVVLPVTLVTFS